MVDLRFALTVILALVAVAIPAYVTTLFAGWELGAVVAVSVALGIGGGRWVMAQQQGGSQPSSPTRGRRQQSKGARSRDR